MGQRAMWRRRRRILFCSTTASPRSSAACLGRRIFANLRKALVYICAIHVSVAGLALLPILMGLPPVPHPAHVMLLNS